MSQLTSISSWNSLTITHVPNVTISYILGKNVDSSNTHRPHQVTIREQIQVVASFILDYIFLCNAFVLCSLHEPYLWKHFHLDMEKSKSFSAYHSASYSDMRAGFEERSTSYSFNGPCIKRDVLATNVNPDVKRRKRVASYNMYTMEAKLKSSFRNSFKWIKNKLVDDYYDEWTKPCFACLSFWAI